MKILVTGARGYVGSSLVKALISMHEVTGVTRADFDFCDPKATRRWFAGKKFDAVLHTAIAGGSRLKSDDLSTTVANLSMWSNLRECRDSYAKLISFGSGAEVYFPNTYYGASKKYIADAIEAIPNCYNLRIFGIFDHLELPTRFIKANLLRYMNNERMEVHENRRMDFFYMPDLVSLVNYYLWTASPPKQIDCTYEDSPTLYEIANYINSLSHHRVPVVGTPTTHASPDLYCGTFRNLDIPLIGWRLGIIRTWKELSCLPKTV